MNYLRKGSVMVGLAACAIAAVAAGILAMRNYEIEATSSSVMASKVAPTDGVASVERFRRLVGVPSDPVPHNQKPVKSLQRKATELRGLLPQPGGALGFGLLFRDVHVDVHHEMIRNKFIRAAAANQHGPLDVVRVVGRSSRGAEGTGYVMEIVESRAIADAIATAMTFTQKRLPPEPGLPEGTFTGLPIGEWSRYSAPDPAPGTPPVREMGCGLTVYDSTIAMTSTVHYPIRASGGRPGSERITDEDLLMAEYQARLVLSAALLVENDFESMRRGEMSVGASRVPTRRTGDGVVLVELARWAEAVGATVVNGVPGRGVFPGGFVPVLPDSGVWTVSRGGRTVVVALAARALIAGSMRVDLPFPVVKGGDDVWVAVEALRDSLSG